MALRDIRSEYSQSNKKENKLNKVMSQTKPQAKTGELFTPLHIHTELWPGYIKNIRINRHYKSIWLVNFEIIVNLQSLTGESEVPFNHWL